VFRGAARRERSPRPCSRSLSLSHTRAPPPFPSLPQERETLASFGYADIYRWGGSSTQFNIIIWNPEAEDTDDVSMFTSQAADMAALILDYINAIMASTDS
jgi:hypothetical protein